MFYSALYSSIHLTHASSQQLLEYLNSQSQNTSSIDHLAGDLQNLGLSQSTSPNPFRSQPGSQTTGYSLFVSPGNNQRHSAQPATALNPFHGHPSVSPASYAHQLGHQAYTPGPGHSEYGLYGSYHQPTGTASSGFLAPAQVNPGPGRPSTSQQGRRRSQTPAIGQSQPQQYATSITRPQSAQVRSASRSSDHSSSGSNMRGMRVQKQKDWRGFFKQGRVSAPPRTQTGT
jgi:hypothetical protein